MSSSAIEKKDAIFALAESVVNVKYEHIPTEAAGLTKMDILDTLGVSIAASGVAPECKRVTELVKEMAGKEESTIIGYGGKVPSYMASFANAMLAHSLNYDDLHDAFGLHIGCMVLPAALAMAERVGKVSGEEFITAYTLSVDLECRLARALVLRQTPRDWGLYGWLLPQLFGYFGATAAAGRLLGLNVDQLVSAFGLAYSQAAGNKQPFISTGSDKGIYPSYPAKAGVLSTLIAQKGIAGPKDSLEGKAGLYKVYFQGEYDSASLTTDLGKSFEGVGFYRFPCCSLNHPSIEVTLRMVDEHKFRAQDVEAITVFVGGKVQDLCEPLEIRRNPRIMTEAQLSLPFTIATAIAKGKPRIEHFTTDGIKDPEILRLSNKVSCQSDPECYLQFGTGAHPAKVEIKLRDGHVLHSEQKGFRSGHPKRPISKAELIEKFRDCVSYSVRPLPKDSAEEVIKMVDKLEKVDDVSEIIELVSQN